MAVTTLDKIQVPLEDVALESDVEQVGCKLSQNTWEHVGASCPVRTT